tara:strand:- start:3072 stop:4127 length:1056 start_codon:yes stop_codon:yes gene_type:complete
MNVTLFSGLQGDGYSMHLYCRELAKSFSQDINVKIVHPPNMLLPSSLNKALSKWLFYLVKAGLKNSQINHILDHGYSHLLLALDKSKTVVTCHDLHPLELPNIVSGKTRNLFKKKIEIMLCAKKIIAVSEHTKQDILKHFPQTDPEKIVVIPMGVSESFKRLKPKEIKAAKQKFGLTEKKIMLHVGQSLSYKNIQTLLTAFSSLKNENNVLVKVGGFSDNEKTLIKRSGVRDRIVSIPFVSENELVELYNIADVFVFPSLHEGFGLPVLEAMKCGCPIICSNTASLPEVTGEAALFTDPYDIPSISSGIEKILSTDSLRKKMRKASLKQAENFSWEKTSKKTEEVYKVVLA